MRVRILVIDEEEKKHSFGDGSISITIEPRASCR